MVNTETVRTVIGIIGNIISACLFLSPLPTMYNIYKEKSVQLYKPDPYVATVLSCAMWVFYGMPFVHPDSLLVVTTNGAGLVIELIYIVIFITYSSWPKRRNIIIALLVEIAILAVMIIITMTTMHDTKKRSMLVGTVCVVLNILMYTSPLTVMGLVIRSKSVKYMPLSLSLSNFANGITWLIYALLKLDLYVAIPNGLGALSGAVQLILYATYYGTTNWDEDEDERPSNHAQPSEVQLSNMGNNS